MTKTRARPAGADPLIAFAATRVPVPLISVIVPTKNVGSWVVETIRSIQSQTERSLEIIVVDDDSTDSTIELVADLAGEDPRIRLVSNAGSGGAAARNLGVTLARGTYMVFADGDDIVPADAYERMHASLSSSGSDLVAGDFLNLTSTTTTARSTSLGIYRTPSRGVSVEDVPDLLRDRVCWNKMFVRRWWTENGIAFRESRRSNDIHAMTVAYSLAIIDIIPDITYIYRARSGATSMTSSRIHPESMTQHFAEELACYRTVRSSSSSAVVQHFLHGVLAFAAWRYVADYITSDEMGALDESVYSSIREMVDGADSEVWARLSADQRRVYRLFSAGELDLISLMREVASKGGDQGYWTSRLPELIELDRVTEGDCRNLFADILRAQYLAPFRAAVDAAEEDPSIATDLVTFQRALVPRGRLSPEDRALVDTAARFAEDDESGTDSRVAGADLVGVRARLSSLVLRVSAGNSPVTALRATPATGGGSTVVFPSIARPGTGDGDLFVLEARRLGRAGTAWRLEAEIAPDQVVRVRPPSALAPASRLSGLFVIRDDRHDSLLVQTKRPLYRRIGSVVKRRLHR